jgi:hypothetical protein
MQNYQAAISRVCSRPLTIGPADRRLLFCSIALLVLPGGNTRRTEMDFELRHQRMFFPSEVKPEDDSH